MGTSHIEPWSFPIFSNSQNFGANKKSRLSRPQKKKKKKKSTKFETRKQGYPALQVSFAPIIKGDRHAIKPLTFHSARTCLGSAALVGLQDKIQNTRTKITYAFFHEISTILVNTRTSPIPRLPPAAKQKTKGRWLR